ncbi:phage tail protein [Aquincola sp. MAHUQ-54]|uniref:Phage tail protein n=1 Tax=Aquincola agrisoli TaxID=3119538 RepID=A0AAW9QAU3_9BURK
MNARYLPPVARAPHDPRTRVLDARLGWAPLALAGLTGGVAPSAEDGALALAALPGSGRLLAEPGGSFGGLVPPRHVAWLADGTLALLDAAHGRLLRLDRCGCRFAPWPCLEPDGLRVPAGATGLGAGCGLLYVAAPPLARVVVLDASNGALRAAWPSPPGAPPWAPVHALPLEHGGLVAVADAARGGVHLCSRRGRALRFIGGLGAVRALAVDAQGRLCVQRDGEAAVLLVDVAAGTVVGTAERPAELARRFAPLPFATHPGGSIDIAPLCEPPAAAPRWVGPDGAPLAAPPPPALPAYPAAGTWLSGPLDSGEDGGTWDRVELLASLPAGTRLHIAFAADDALLTDAELAEPSRWHPAGEWRRPGGESDLACARADWMLHHCTGRHGWLRLALAGDTRSTPRVHRMQVDGLRTSLRRYLPAVFGADPVAAEFSDRWLAIFDRTLRDIEAQVDTQARFFDPLAAPAAPEVDTRHDFLRWLAAWVGVALPAGWPLARQRQVLASAPRLYAWRGTPAGLAAALSLLLGLDRWAGHAPAPAGCVPCPTGRRADAAPRWRPPRLVLEHYRLRRWMAAGHARLSDAAKLWGDRIVNRSRLEAGHTLEAGGGSGGARLGVTQLLTMQDPLRDPFHVHAHRLSVFVPAGCIAAPGREAALARFIAAEVPAHAEARLVVVHPRMRVGVQSSIGLDAVIGLRTRPPVLGDASAPLGRATVLPAAGSPRTEPPRGAGRVRVGQSTVIR